MHEAYVRLLHPQAFANVSQPSVRPIVRGKAVKPVGFGMKRGIGVADSRTQLRYVSFALITNPTIWRFHRREGHYLTRIVDDKIYLHREKLVYWKARGIWLSGLALGRHKKVKSGIYRRIIFASVGARKWDTVSAWQNANAARSRNCQAAANGSLFGHFVCSGAESV